MNLHSLVQQPFHEIPELFDDLVQHYRVPGVEALTKSEKLNLSEAFVSNETVYTTIVPISPENTLTRIQIFVAI